MRVPMGRAHVLSLLWLCAVPGTTWAADAVHPAVLAPGHTLDYSVSLDGQAYLALHRKGSSAWMLTAVALRAKQVDPDRVDISSAVAGAGWFVRHPGLRAGSVRAAELSDSTQRSNAGRSAIGLLDVGDEIRLKLDGVEARLVKAPSATELHVGSRHTMLSGSGKDYPAYLEWAGDLDGDRRFDLIMSFTRDGHQETCLFLSTAASEGALIGNVGCMMASG
jgi:hypothetical protein